MAGRQGQRRVLYRDGALADGTGPELRLGLSLLVEDGRIAWLRPSDDEGPGATDPDVDVVDASGSTFVPGMVDGHGHLSLPGGAHWIDRGSDPTEALLAAAEHNASLATRSGVRWVRDVGAPRRADPEAGRDRGINLRVRDAWRERTRGAAARPYVRAAGTWLTRSASLPAGLAVEASNADELLSAALRQLDDGADLVKLYLDGPDPATCPWSVHEVRRVVEAAHARGARVTAHAGRLDGARVGAEAAVDALEHGFELEAGVAATMASNGVFLVTTLAVLASWQSFAATTTLPRFAADEGRAVVARRREAAEASVAAAHVAGVRLAAGTDFGGGSTRANQLAWEVACLVRAGLEPWEALRAATLGGGELLGEPEAGRIEEGGPADFFLVHGDPLSDPAALWRVWRVAWLES